jgi:hypothetical protein
MARDMGAWRRVVLFIGFSTAGLTLLSVAVTTFLYGTGFMATGPRRRLFREFAVIQRHPNKAKLPNEQQGAI